MKFLLLGLLGLLVALQTGAALRPRHVRFPDRGKAILEEIQASGRNFKLGTPDSLALQRLLWVAKGFDCRARRGTFPRFHVPDEKLWYAMLHITNLAFSWSTWEEGYVDHKVPDLATHRVLLPKAAATGFIEACYEMQHLSDRSLLVAKEKLGNWSADEGNPGDFLELPLWASLDPEEVDTRAEELTARTRRYRLQRMRHLTHSKDVLIEWPRVALEQLVLLLESFFALQIVNSYEVFASFVQSLKPLPRVFFFDYFGDRVGVVLKVLGNLVHDPSRVLVEVGVHNGTFATAFVSQSAMQYIGCDPYSDDRIFKNRVGGAAMFYSVQKRLRRAAGSRTALHRLHSKDAARTLALPTTSGMADAVFIDGEHELPDVLEDLRAWWPRVAPGGLLFGHDFAAPFTPVVAAAAAFCDEVRCPRLNIGLDGVFWIEKLPP